MKHFLHGFLVLQAFRLCAFGQVLLYQENFPYPGPSGSLPVSSFGWSNAIPNNPNRLYQLSGTNGAVFAYQGDTDVPISTAFFTTTTLDSGATGMAFPSFNPAQFTGLTLSADIQPYYLPDSIAARFAVQMNGANWFAAATALPVPTTVGGFATYTQAFNPAATFWNSLTIRSTNAVIGVVATSNLLGNITGAGLVFTHTVHGGTHNFDNFLITATGQFNPTNAPSLTITFSDVGQAPWNVTNFGKIPENYQPGELLGSGILTHWINVGGYTGGPDHTTGTGFSAREYNGGISPSIVLFNQHVVVRSVFVDAFNGQGTHIYVRGYTYSNSPVPVITVDVPTRSHPWGGGYQWIQVTNLDGIPLQKLVVESSVYGDNAQFDDITIQPAPTNNIPPRDFLYNKLTIMPLGDSITWGVDAPGGFRTKLYQNLKRAGYDFTFIGSDTTNPGPLPLPQDQQAREGHPGYTISQDNSNLDANVPPYPTDNDSNNGGYWLTRLNRPPDIILIHLGTNDIGGGGNGDAAAANMDALLSHIYALAPNAHVIVAKIIALGFSGLNTNVIAFNNQLPGIVANHAATGQHVTLVDQYANFVDDQGTVKGYLLADGVHPMQAGYDLMADTFFHGIRALFPTIVASNQPPCVVGAAPVQNFSFETNALADGGVSASMPGWIVSAPDGGIYNPQAFAFTNANDNTGGQLPAPGQGRQVGFLFNGTNQIGTLQQILPDVDLVNDTIYTLSVAVGRPLYSDSPDKFSGYKIQLLAGEDVITSQPDSFVPVAGTFQDATLVFTASTNTVATNLIGRALMLRLSSDRNPSGSGASTFFDNVRLTIAPILPVLTIAPSGTNVIVRWLTSGCYNYTLQRADDLVTGSWTDVPGASSPYTNSVTATARFYRLKR